MNMAGIAKNARRGYSSAPQEPEERKKPAKSTVDFLNNDGAPQPSLWLVQIPRFVMDVWGQLPEGEGLGYIDIQQIAGKTMPEVSMHLRQDYHQNIPVKFQVTPTQIVGDQLQVFTETGPGKIKTQGRIAYKLSVKATEDDAVHNTIQEKSTEISAKQKNEVKLQFEETNRAIDPKSSRRPNGKKIVKDKRIAAEEHVLIPLILQCFEEKDLWTLSALNTRLKQPEEHLKSFLRRLCDYHSQGPSRAHWELKPEYRANKKRKLNEEPMDEDK